MPQDDEDDGWAGGGEVSLDLVADRVRSVSLLLSELRRLPPESPLVVEGLELMRTVREGLRPHEPGTRH